MNTKVYDCMMSNTPVIDKEYLSNVLKLDRSHVISDIEICQVTESNTSLVIKFKVLIKKDGNNDSTRRFFIKTIKSLPDTHVYDSLSLNEVKFYKLLKNVTNPKLPIPQCFDTYISEDKSKYLLLLEDVSDEFDESNTVDLCTENIWLSAASSLANFHAAFWNSHIIGTKNVPIDSKEKINFYIRSSYESYEKFIKYVGHRFDGETIDIYEHALRISIELETERYERLINKENITLIHGDSHIHNFMFPHNQNGTPIIMDFQFWNAGIGAGDIAQLTRLSFPKTVRQKLHQSIVEKYYEVLLAKGVQDYSWDNCWNDYRKMVASMVLIPVWQYTSFNLEYDYWKDNISSLVLNYKSLCCDQL